MGFIDRIVEGRALKEAEALHHAKVVCERQHAKLNIAIAGFEGEKARVTNDFYAAHDIGNGAEEKLCLDSIRSIEFSIRTLEHDREVWGKLISILRKIETFIDILQRHKKYWTIVRAIPYRKLKAENYDISTVEPLINDFQKVYESLRDYMDRIRRLDADFDRDLKKSEQTHENIRAIDEQLNPVQADANADLMRELLEKRNANKASNISPVDIADDNDDDNVAPA